VWGCFKFFSIRLINTTRYINNTSSNVSIVGFVVNCFVCEIIYCLLHMISLLYFLMDIIVEK